MFRRVIIKTYFLDYGMTINYRTCDISWYIEGYAQKSDQTFCCIHQNSGTTYRLHSSDIGYLTLLMMSLNLHYAKFNWIFPSHIKLSDSIMIKRHSLFRWFHAFYFLCEININQVFTAFFISILNIVCSVVSIFNNMQYGTYTLQISVFIRRRSFLWGKNKIFNETNRLFIPALWNTFTPAHILGSLLSLFMIWSLYTKSVHKIKLTMLIRVDIIHW